MKLILTVSDKSDNQGPIHLLTAYCHGEYIRNLASRRATFAEFTCWPQCASVLRGMNFKGRVQYKIAMRRLVFIGLACYFIVQIIYAKEKLESKKIATLVREVNSETVQGS